MYSLLDSLDEYMKMNNISADYVEFNYEYLPEYINYAILYAVRWLDENEEFSLGKGEYTLRRNREGNLFIKTENDKDSKKLLISAHPERLIFREDSIVISERKIFQYAYLLQNNKLKLLEIRNIISKIHPELNKLDRLKLEYKYFMDFLNQEIIKNQELGIDILEGIDFESVLSNSYKKMVALIDEFEREDKEILSSKNKKVIIDYIPKSDEGNLKKSHKSSGLNTKERTNDIIPLVDRQNTLETYKFIYSGVAYSNEQNNISYICYLYRDERNKFMLILEPTSGAGYTKVVCIDAEWLERNEFIELVRKYLELSLKETFTFNNIVRTCHTTLDVFRDEVSYTVTGQNGRLMSPYTKQRLKKLKS